MKIHKTYKFRAYPNEEQLTKVPQQSGNTRFVWNHFLNLNIKEYNENKKFIFGYDLMKTLPKLKKEFTFLKSSYSQCLQQVGLHFDKAIHEFIKKQKGFPKHKKKLNKSDSIHYPQSFKIGKNYVQLPKLGKIKIIKHREIKGKVRNVTLK